MDDLSCERDSLKFNGLQILINLQTIDTCSQVIYGMSILTSGFMTMLLYQGNQYCVVN